MALDPIGRQYADKLFQQRMEEILKVQGAELTGCVRITLPET